jgi:hypothetical protein
MRWIVAGIAAICLAPFFWMWALRDASFALAAGSDGASWQRHADIHLWTGHALLIGAIAMFVFGWLKLRRKGSSNTEA